MPVCAPVKELKFENSPVKDCKSVRHLKRDLMKVVNDGHEEAMKGKTVEAKKLTSDIRKSLNLAS